MTHFNNNIEWLMRTFNRMHKNCINLEMEKRGLSGASHPFILFVLRYEMKNMTASQKELGEAVGISPVTVAISIKRMEKAGLVRKVPDEKDLRCNVITLTEKGLKFIEESTKVLDEIHQGIFKGFSESELEDLKKYYIRMIHNLELMGTQVPAQFKKRDGEKQNIEKTDLV